MSKTQIATGGLADNAVVTGKITDGTIATADIADSAVTAAKASGLGITVAEQWELLGSNTVSSDGSETDFSSPAFLSGLTGSAQMTQSSGIFTFPSTGFWEIKMIVNVFDNGDAHRQFSAFIKTTTNNSTYSTKAQSNCFIDFLQSNNTHASGYTQHIFDVTNTSTHKVKFARYHSGSSLTIYRDNQGCTVTFTRLGDT